MRNYDGLLARLRGCPFPVPLDLLRPRISPAVAIQEIELDDFLEDVD